MDAHELYAAATQSARDQLQVADEMVAKHLDQAERIHQRAASEALVRMAELETVARVARELQTAGIANPTSPRP